MKKWRDLIVHDMRQLSFFDNILDTDTDPFDHPQVSTWFKNQNRISIPIELVRDFDQFMDYLCHHSIQLTNTINHISRKHLPSINERLTIKAEEATDYTQQEDYPYIHFFYHIALTGRLIQLESIDSTKPQLTVTERWNLYNNNLTDTEKYFFLLETFWIDVNWAKILDKKDNPVHIVIEDVFSKLLDRKSNSHLQLKDSLLSKFTFHWGYFFVYLEWFGFWVCEHDHQATDHYHSNKKFIVHSVTLTTFGKQMIPILLNNRHPQNWNIPYRRETGEVNPIPGSELDVIGNTSKQSNKRKDQSFQPFYKAFEGLFIKIVLRKTLPRQERAFTPGKYTFKIVYDKHSWCKVALTAQHTMEDLHKIIIKTFQFDHDHLYSFFMDGIKGSKTSIVAPLDHSGSPIASNVLIGSVGLSVGQRFLYLFDYENEWTLTITVEQIVETGSEQERPRPYLIEHQGNGPEQYFYNETF